VDVRKENKMAKCNKCNTEENIVYSGTAALLLGVIDQVEQICYDCANKQAGEPDTNKEISNA
jgi:hypothetical protein